MTISEIISLFQTASPWVVLAVTALVLVKMSYDFFRDRSKQSEYGALLETLRVVERCAQGNADMLSGMVVATEERSDSLSDSLRAQTALLTKIAQELINLNASSVGSVISVENSRHIVTHQWNWCRDEVAKIIANSIRNNHFKGDEERVTRRVARAWRKVADNAVASIAKFEGMSYPYQELFDSHIAEAWSQVWSWALPIYHRDYLAPAESVIDDLVERTKMLFNDVLSTYMALVEDVDSGLLYRTDPGAVRTPSNESGIHHGLGTLEVADMADALRNYEPGQGSGPYNVERVRRAQQERYRQESSRHDQGSSGRRPAADQ